MKLIKTLISAVLLLPVGLGQVAGASTDEADPDKASPGIDYDVIAKVGDQKIHFSEINVAMNSSAIVGVSIPALGTPDRDTARITLLDRFVSANLLYLDAIKQGTDKEPAYQKAVTRFSDAILAGLYRKHIQAGEIPVSKEEIQAWYKQNVSADTKELNDDVSLQIESKLRRQKLHDRMASADASLRDDVKVVVYPENLDIKGDAERASDTPLATVGEETITWGEISDRIISAGKGATIADPLAFEDTARRDVLEREIDQRILVQKARLAGLEQDPTYQRRLREYSKTLLIVQHREKLAKQWQPNDEEITAWYEQNRKRFVVPEARKIQMVVLGSKVEAESIKARIDAGEITLYQAARDYSKAANADQNLGDVGWINQGDMVSMLDKAIFALEPGILSDPIESSAGWHLVKVVEINDAKYTDITDVTTRKLTLRDYMHSKQDQYTAELRKNSFPVEVYQDRLIQLAQSEADMVKTLAEKAKQPGSVTQQRIEEIQKMMNVPSK